jgi:hypothetical protein
MIADAGEHVGTMAISTCAASASPAMSALIRCSAATSSGRLSGVKRHAASGSDDNRRARPNPGSQVELICRVRLSRPTSAARFSTASAARSLQQHRQLHPRRHRHPRFGMRSDESAPLPSLGAEALS